MTYRELYFRAIDEALNKKRESSSIKWIFLEVTKKTYAEFILAWNEEVTLHDQNMLENLLDQYLNHFVPVQHLFMKTNFYGLNLNLSKDVLIPRFETEELVEHVLHWIDKQGKTNLKIVDIGTGSGAIALAIKHSREHVEVIATDISSDALEIAKSNAQMHNLAIDFRLGSWFEPLLKTNEKVNIIVSNPPYIPIGGEVNHDVYLYEPHLALFLGSDGLGAYRSILSEASKVLITPSLIAFEHGLDQGEAIQHLALNYFPKAKATTHQDLQGKPRITVIEI